MVRPGKANLAGRGASMMVLYIRSDAKYFVSMGVHHDSFDFWNSRQLSPIDDVTTRLGQRIQ
jgi:alpha-L-fucosidase